MHLSAATRGQQQKYIVPYSRTTVHKESFFPSTIRLWNQLPEATAAALDLESFKRKSRQSDSNTADIVLIVHIVSPLRKHGCFKLSVKMLLLQPCTLMEEEEWTI